MPVFIKGVGCISPQPTYNGQFLNELTAYTGEYFTSAEPDYKAYLNPALIRRMGKILKMGVASASICLQDAKVENPDAIITGTGLGCIVDTDKFLTAIIENEEQFLTPTNFIQSTHNTISAQIALSLKCLNYNYTYVHRGFSLESALQDSIMMLKEGEAKDVLVGGVDEITPTYYAITKRMGFWKKNVDGHLSLAGANTKGTIAGEGATYFVLSQEESSSNYAELKDLATIYRPKDIKEIESELHKFLEKNNLTVTDIDLVILGINGDQRGDQVYHDLADGLFKDKSLAYFKHLSGEYPTSVAFGVWMGAKIMKSQQIPSGVILENTNKGEIKNILIYNHYRDINHSIYLLTHI